MRMSAWTYRPIADQRVWSCNDVEAPSGKMLNMDVKDTSSKPATDAYIQPVLSLAPHPHRGIMSATAIHTSIWT